MSAAMLALPSCAELPLEELIDYDPDWAMLIESVEGDRKEITLRSSDGTTVPVRRGNAVVYENVGGKDIDVTVTYSASKEVDGALEISTLIENNEKQWMVKIWRHPSLKGFKAGSEDAFILPVGTGHIYPLKSLLKAPEKDVPLPQFWSWDKKRKVYQCIQKYPSKYSSMQWAILRSKDRCVYYACHDKNFSYKDLRVTYNPETGVAEMNYVYKMTCMPGQSIQMPATIVRSYEGEWYEGADIYRDWFLAQRDVVKSPEWLKNSTGWFLAILKQQNDEVIVPYDEIGGMLADAAIERGLDILGLFGRGIGGHDRFYPDYSPDPKLGGEKALREGIAKAQERGLKVVLYTNGQLLDQDCSWFWPEKGKNITVQSSDGNLVSQTWHKYHDAPARVHGLACHSCNTWREMMLQLAKDANDLGADGLLYDQLACTSPMYCYNPDHGHPVPAITYLEDRNENMKYVQQEMAKINPEFVVMTEGMIDAQINTVDMFHASGPAFMTPTKKRFLQRFDGTASFFDFAEMYRYTFSEAVMIARLSNPAQTRFTLNYNLSYGVRSEVELRYAADRKYVQDNVIPTKEDYANVKGIPNVELIKEAGDPVESEKYYKKVLTFQKEHAGLLMNGRFLAGRDVRLEASSEYVMANAFEAADGKLGVVVWNVSDEPVSYKVSYPGYTVKSICAPDAEGLRSGDPIAPESVHLVLFER